MTEKPYQDVMRLERGAGTVVESTSPYEAITAAIEDEHEGGWGSSIHLITAYGSQGQVEHTFIVIEGVVYSLDKTELQPDADGSWLKNENVDIKEGDTIKIKWPQDKEQSWRWATVLSVVDDNVFVQVERRGLSPLIGCVAHDEILKVRPSDE